MIFVLSDTHFGDKSALKKSERPFATVEEMDEKILDNINSVVKENDTLYHLGDYSRTDLEFATKIRSKIICKKVYLIAGNHDFANRCSEFDKLFVKVDNIIETQVIGKFCVMCHYPMRVWNKCSKLRNPSIHLYGHLHGTFPPIPKWHLSLDVGLDSHGFKPWSEIELEEYFAPRIKEFTEAKKNRWEF